LGKVLKAEEAFYQFRPDLGVLEHRLVTLASKLASADSKTDLLDSLASEMARDLKKPKGRDRRLVRWGLALSLLSDITNAGGKILLDGSSVSVSWPDWTTEEGKKGLRRSLEKLRDEIKDRRPAPTAEIIKVLSVPFSRAKLLMVLREGEFALHTSKEIHSPGVDYGSIFNACTHYWTMPYRDREGRRERCVLSVTHPSLEQPVPVGILEAGDGAPLFPARDKELGFSVKELKTWLQEGKGGERVRQLRKRVEVFREAMKPILQSGYKTNDFESLYPRLSKIEQQAAGRSLSSVGMYEKKQLAYLGRFIRGEGALKTMLDGGVPSDQDLNAIVRSFRDLVVPRVALDWTICGAIPPFSAALVGKLVIAHAAHPSIRKICQRPPGEIVSKMFKREVLGKLLPKTGVIFLTTKGLFPGHSVQYNRASLPGREEAGVPLKKLGNTEGMTASLLSQRTHTLAAALLEGEESSRAISRTFGTGGSKRQRRIENAVRDLGLKPALLHPRLTRPLYGVQLVDNPIDICYLADRAKWRIPKRLSRRDYGEAATDHWRKRWLKTASRRLEYSGDKKNDLEEPLEEILGPWLEERNENGEK
jgi:hypothetical protein